MLTRNGFAMTDIASLALGNLLTPMTLFFVLGSAAGLARSDLHIPEQLGKRSI
jgi:uncharacterized protein